MKLINLVFIVFICSLSVISQTAFEVEKLFASKKVYIDKSVLIHTDIGLDGNICKAVIQPNTYDTKTLYVGNNNVSAEHFMEVLNKLAPESIRGEKTRNWGMSSLGSRMIDTEYEYENVIINGHTTFTISKDSTDKIEKQDDKNDLLQNIDLSEDKKELKKFDWEEYFKNLPIKSADVFVISWKREACNIK